MNEPHTTYDVLTGYRSDFGWSFNKQRTFSNHADAQWFANYLRIVKKESNVRIVQKQSVILEDGR